MPKNLSNNPKKNVTTSQMVSGLGKRSSRGLLNGQASGNLKTLPDISSRTFATRLKSRYVAVPELPQNLPELQFSESAQKILKERYLLKGGDLEVAETISERFWHVAYDIASAEFDFGQSKKQVLDMAIKFYGMMVRQEFEPNSPTIMNAGKTNGLQYSACFVLPIEDSLPGIFDAIKYAALIHQTGGGTGFSFSRVRPRGSGVKTTGGVASGPVSFLKVFNSATESIKQGGTRRGANMGILRVDHPDVLEFIRCKAELDDNNRPTYEAISPLLPDDQSRDYLKTLMLDRQISNFNISVAVTDKFMEAYYKGADYELIDPRSKQVTGYLNAKEVFDEITDRAWHTGDPGIVFIDRINNSTANPVNQLEEIEATNPCVTEDTWVHTNIGPQKVRDLIGKPFLARVNGVNHLSGLEGFFKTGERDVFRLQTVEGYNLSLTSNHLVKRVVNIKTNETQWCEVGNLHIGDTIVINNHRQNSNWQGKYSGKEGYLVGLLVGDGTLKSDKAVLSVWDNPKLSNLAYISGAQSVMQYALDSAYSVPHRNDFSGWIFLPLRNEYRMSLGYVKQLAHELGMFPGDKTITEQVEKTSSDFYEGFLRGLFDADGSVQNVNGGINIRLAQSSLVLLEAVQRMLLRLGIFSRIYKNRRKAGKKLLPNGKGGYKEYPVKAQHELSISKNSVEVFNELIGFANTEKTLKLLQLLKSHNKRGLYKENFVARVESVKFESKKGVYDVQISDIHYFDANGIIVHNCGEQPLNGNDACNLGSINLGKMIKADGSGVDWEKLGEITRSAVSFLDNVVQTNPYTLEQIWDKSHNNRRIGLGVMGWADMLFKLRIPYNSQEALKLAEQVMAFINREGHLESQKLAQTRGAFPNWPYSIYKDDKPIRNSTVTTIAPTGTISIIADCSSGVEPVFALAYIHKARAVGNQYRILTIANQTFEEIAQREGFYTKDLAQKVMENGSVKGLSEVPEDWQRVFVTAPEIAPEWHVKMQAAFQKYTDNGVSKTINLPNTATVADVARAYLMAWETGCLGITVYRDGSKAVQVLNVSSTLKPKAEVAEALNQEIALQSQDTIAARPMVLRGRTYEIMTPMGKAFVTINRDDQDLPFEIFVTLGKGGMHTMADAEAIGRLASLALRVAGRNRKQIAQKIADQLQGIGGSFHIGFGKDRVMSLADALGKVLADELSQSPDTFPEPIPLNLTISDAAAVSNSPKKSAADFCPECGQASFVREDGCQKCYSCGYSKC